MKINYINDYRARTAGHFTTYVQPEEIQRLVIRNRTLLADIAANATNTIARQAEAALRRQLPSGRVDLLV
jgi:hypothetical protein